MGADLRIESLYDLAWAIHGPEYNQAVAVRDNFATEIRNRLGPEIASEIQRHIGVALRRLQADDVPNPIIMKMRSFYELLALQMAVEEIERRIEAESTFFAPYINGVLPTLGLSWWRDVLPLLNGRENPGYLRLENVVKFLKMVTDADQRLPSGKDNEEMTDHFRQRRRELIEFLERAVELGEAVWCDL